MIRNARLRLGWSREFAAAEIGIGRTQLWYLEHSQRALGDRTCERIIQGLRLRGKAVRMLRDAAIPGWHTRTGNPPIVAYGRGNRAPRARPVPVAHLGPCWQHMMKHRHPWKAGPGTLPLRKDLRKIRLFRGCRARFLT